jgi:hypothetical protein
MFYVLYPFGTYLLTPLIFYLTILSAPKIKTVEWLGDSQ